VTSKLPSRVYEHREGLVDGFTKTYGLKRLVWYESNESMTAAIQREKSLKKYTANGRSILSSARIHIGTTSIQRSWG